MTKEKKQLLKNLVKDFADPNKDFISDFIEEVVYKNIGLTENLYIPSNQESSDKPVPFLKEAKKKLENTIENPENLNKLLNAYTNKIASIQDGSYSELTVSQKKFFSNFLEKLAVACMAYIVAKLSYNPHFIVSDFHAPIKNGLLKEFKIILEDKKITKKLFSHRHDYNPSANMLKDIVQKIKPQKKSVLFTQINTEVTVLEKLETIKKMDDLIKETQDIETLEKEGKFEESDIGIDSLKIAQKMENIRNCYTNDQCSKKTLRNLVIDLLNVIKEKKRGSKIILKWRDKIFIFINKFKIKAGLISPEKSLKKYPVWVADKIRKTHKAKTVDRKANIMANFFSKNWDNFLNNFILKPLDQKVDDAGWLFEDNAELEKKCPSENEIKLMKTLELGQISFKFSDKIVSLKQDDFKLHGESEKITGSKFKVYDKENPNRFIYFLENAKLCGEDLGKKLTELSKNPEKSNMTLYDALNELLQSSKQISIQAESFAKELKSVAEFKKSIAKLARACRYYVKTGTKNNIDKNQTEESLINIFSDKKTVKKIFLKSLEYRAPLQSADLSSAVILKILKNHTTRTEKNTPFLNFLQKKIDMLPKKHNILVDFHKLKIELEKDGGIWARYQKDLFPVVHVKSQSTPFAEWYAENEDNILDYDGKQKFSSFCDAVDNMKPDSLKNRFLALLNKIASFFNIPFHKTTLDDWRGQKKKLEKIFPIEPEKKPKASL